MPDITMCVNADCPIREFCYRYRAKPDDIHQSFAVFEFTLRGGFITQCAEFWDLREEKRPVDLLEWADSRNKGILKQIKGE